MGRIASEAAEDGAAETGALASPSIVYRARRVLAIRPFRRLWGVTYLCSTADWLTLLGLTGYVTKLTDSYMAQNFAFTGVVLTLLLPGLLFAPLGGLLADRFDRRTIMASADVVRCGLLLSIAVVGEPLWLFIGSFLVGFCSMLWIPSKDAAVPNLLRRPDQVETANQLNMVMTYGVAVVSGAGLYAVITGIGPALGQREAVLGTLGLAKIILVINALLYLTSAILIATRIPELSRRNVHPVRSDHAAAVAKRDGQPRRGLFGMILDGARYVHGNRLVRGLLVGMLGAFAAGGAVIGSSNAYATSLMAGDAAFGLLFIAVFTGMSLGMTGTSRLARRLPHERLFGLAIVGAGIALCAVALSPHLFVSLFAVGLVGACAGAAFLAGVTIIGTRIDDDIRGRINAIYQSLMKVVLGGTMAAVPLLIGLMRPRTVTIFGNPVVIDGTRPILLSGGVLAALVGLLAYWLMDTRRGAPVLADLRNALRRTPRRVNGLLIAIEGTSSTDTQTQAAALANRLSGQPRPVRLATDPALNDHQLSALLSATSLTGARARALAAAAVRADVVERDVRPALDQGAVVVMERFVDSPVAQLTAEAGLDAEELEGLADWATGSLRPDVTVLLDIEPDAAAGQLATDQRWRIRGLLAEMAAADPGRYVVVDAKGDSEEVADRVHTAVKAALVDRGLLAATPTTRRAEVV
ncbi:dTMP kinase [Haloechinothrix alba]|uniref:Thymidylate kinase n=1 Tax=Haloechinothrix alba TaxID=664784 RepID=A0A238XUC2_9PSEU|nr:dTMP kinase [Haloechinothrix alba]